MANKNQMLADGQSFGPYSGGDDLGAVVAEIGSYTTKMGYAGEDLSLIHISEPTRPY